MSRLHNRFLPASIFMAGLVAICTLGHAQSPAPQPAGSPPHPAAQQTVTPGPPKPQPTPEQLGDALMAHQRYQAAIEAYKKAPTNEPAVWNKLGIAYQLMFDLADAKQSYEKAHKLDPKNSNVLNNLGTVFDAMKQYRNAEKMYRKALKIDPHSALILKNLGTNLLAQHKYEKGWQQYQLAVKYDPNIFQDTSRPRVENPASVSDRGAMNYYMARGCVRAGMPERAIRYLRMALNEGYTNPKKIIADKEFASLHGLPAFEELARLPNPETPIAESSARKVRKVGLCNNSTSLDWPIRLPLNRDSVPARFACLTTPLVFPRLASVYSPKISMNVFRPILALTLLLAPATLTLTAQDPSPEPPPGQSGQRDGRAMWGGGGMMGRGVTGTVTEVAPDQFTIKSESGDLYTIHYSVNTHILKGGGGLRRQQQDSDVPFTPPAAIKPTDIKVGDAIGAAGEIDTAAKSVGAVVIFQVDPATAKRIRDMQANYGKTWLMGRVTAINEVQVTIQSGPDNATRAFTADENTTFRKRRAPITLADIHPGDAVRVEGALKNNAFVATTVSVMGPRPERDPGP